MTSLNSHVWMRVLKFEAHLLTLAIEATRDEAKQHFLKYDSFILWAWRCDGQVSKQNQAEAEHTHL